MTDFIGETLWADTVCRTHIQLRTARIVSDHPATTVTQQTCWLDNVESVARYHLNRLECEQVATIAGVVVERTSAHARLTYRVAGGAACNLENAVKQVVFLAREREAVSESVRGSGVA